jgi:hypothetical protein
MKADRPDCSNYFNQKNDGGEIVSCNLGTDCKLSSSPGIADRYSFLINNWNTLPESYQQRVYNDTLDTVKRQFRQAKNLTPTVVIDLDAARVKIPILLDY